MGELSLNLPVVGEKDTTAEPKVGTALSEIQTQFNGKIAAVNLEAGAVTEPKIEAALREKLGLSRGKSIIATEQERENVAFGTLPTPDEVTVTMPENGLIAVWYQATWKNSSAATGRAAIFVGANQLQTAFTSAPVAQAAAMPTEATTNFVALFSAGGGLLSVDSSVGYGSDVTTGQVVGATVAATGKYGFVNAESAANTPALGPIGGPCYIFAAAGSYKISIQFKSSAGKVTVKNRKLWVEAKAF